MLLPQWGATRKEGGDEDNIFKSEFYLKFSATKKRGLQSLSTLAPVFVSVLTVVMRNRPPAHGSNPGRLYIRAHLCTGVPNPPDYPRRTAVHCRGSTKHSKRVVKCSGHDIGCFSISLLASSLLRPPSYDPETDRAQPS